MNEITLGGLPVYEAPHGVEGVNYFQMHTGAARYGIGKFAMMESDYETMTGGADFNGTATLSMSCDDPGGSGTQTVSFSVQVAGYQPLSVPPGMDDDTELVAVIVFDLRCHNTHPVKNSYNVQQQGFPYSMGNPIFYPSTTYASGGTAWTWSQMLTDLEFPSTWPSLPSWNPRNLIWDQVPQGRVFDEIAQLLFNVIGFDPTKSSTSGTSGLTAYAPGDQAAGNQSLLSQAEQYQTDGDDSDRDDNRLPGTYDVSFQAVDPSSSDPFANRFYVSSQSTGSDGSLQLTQQLNIGEYWAVGPNGSFTNTDELDAVASDMATRAFNFASAEIGDAEYAGLWSFVTDGQIRGIRWISDRRGARTYVRFNDARDFSPIDQLRRANEIANNQLVCGLGGTTVSVGQSGKRFIHCSADRITPCLLVLSTGSSGGYDGTSWTTCSYGYDGYALGDTGYANKLFSDLQPSQNHIRISGLSYGAATRGEYLLSNGATVLWTCNEVPSTQTCSGLYFEGSNSGGSTT
jgi:hypothetical protein